MNIIVTGYLKQNLPTESRKQFSGILITKNGGKQLFQENTWSIIGKCTTIGVQVIK